MDTEPLSLTDAASRIGKSERQLRRYIGQGKILTVETASGPRVQVEALDGWLSNRQDKLSAKMAGSVKRDGHEVSNGGQVTQSDGAMSANLEAALALSARLVEQLAATQEKLDLERENREREQRQAEALRAELSSYRRALTDAAESLAEQRARTLHLEAIAEQSTNTFEHQVDLERIKNSYTNSYSWTWVGEQAGADFGNSENRMSEPNFDVLTEILLKRWRVADSR